MVYVVDNPWASWGICTREGNLGRWTSCATASSDGDLEARGVELDTRVCPRRVESNKLMAYNVVPVCKGLGDNEGVRLVCDEWILFQGQPQKTQENNEGNSRTLTEAQVPSAFFPAWATLNHTAAVPGL